ncbi:hypothetical protein ACOSQ3_024290 [Xanthoceras sorbifolium]
MSSLSDQKHHEADVDGFSTPEELNSRPVNEVVIEYEWFMSKQLAIYRSKGAAEAHIFELAEVSSLGGHDEGVGVALGEDEVDDSSQTAYERLQPQVESFPSLPSVITRKNLLGFASTFHLPKGYKVMVPKVTDRPARSPSGYIAISSHHLNAGLRFILPTFLLCVLNLLRLASMQLTPNSYAQLISFYLTFRRRGFGSPSDNIIRYCYSLKKCPLSEKSFGSAWHKGIYYLPVQANEYQGLLQTKIKSNVGNYKTAYFFIKGPGIKSIRHKCFVSLPRKSAL